MQTILSLISLEGARYAILKISNLVNGITTHAAADPCHDFFISYSKGTVNVTHLSASTACFIFSSSRLIAVTLLLLSTATGLTYGAALGTVIINMLLKVYITWSTRSTEYHNSIDVEQVQAE